MSVVPPELFKQGMALWPTGVMVVTTRGPADQPWAVTINSWASASLEPPLVSFYLKSSAWCVRGFHVTSLWGAHILCADQAATAQHYAQPGGALWAGGREIHPCGSPLLPNTLVRMECQTCTLTPVGDHTLVVGRVRHLVCAEGGNPLVYWGRVFQKELPLECRYEPCALDDGQRR